MQFDPESNLISITLGKGKITHTNEVGNFIIHLTAAKKPVLIEILDASKFMGQFEKIKNLKEIQIAMQTNA